MSTCVKSNNLHLIMQSCNVTCTSLQILQNANSHIYGRKLKEMFTLCLFNWPSEMQHSHLLTSDVLPFSDQTHETSYYLWQNEQCTVFQLSQSQDRRSK